MSMVDNELLRTENRLLWELICRSDYYILQLERAQRREGDTEEARNKLEEARNRYEIERRHVSQQLRAGSRGQP